MELRSTPNPNVELSTRLVQLLLRYLGRGPNEVHATVDDKVATVTFTDTLTKAERNLVSAGEGDAVVTSRRTFQQLMRKEAVAVVEEALQRKVAGYMSDIDPQADVAAMVFVFESRKGSIGPTDDGASAA